MAATQAETQQQNEVNRDQVLQDQPPDLSNSVLQNGTEKNGGRGIVGSDNLVNIKTKLPGQNSHPVEMSQYRQESGAGPPIHNSSGNGEQNTNNLSVDNSKLNSDGKQYPLNSEQNAGNDQNYGKGLDSGRNMQGYGNLGFPGRGNYHPEHHSGGNPVQNSADGSLHHPFSQFSPQSMRQGFPSSKPMPGTPMVPPRPPSGGPNMNAPAGGFSPHGQQQRFMSGQSISQPTGPTPTLNQLLQSSNPVHRYQNSYGEFGMQKSGEQGGGAPSNPMPYNQTWPPQRPLASYSPQQATPGYRNQPPGSAPRGQQQQQQQQQQPPYLGGPGAPGPGGGGSGGGGGGGGGYPTQQQQPPPPSQQQQQPGGPASQPGTASQQQQQQQQQQHQYPPYPQRYPTPPGPGQGSTGRQQPPFSPHQLNTPYGQQQQQQQQSGSPGQPPQQPPQHGGYGGSWGPSQPGQQHTPQPPNQPPPPPQQNQHPPGGGGGPPNPPQSPQHQPVPSPQPHPHPQASPQPQHPPPSPGQQHPPPHSPHPPPQQQQHSQHLQQSPHPTQQSQFPNRPQQSSTPNAHAPDTGDLTNQNSNDSSSGLGPAPGTPGMRPTPSPTGSTGSRSMSPAVGQQNIPMPPHPPNNQSDASGGPPGRMSHSPMAAQGGYPQQPPGGQPLPPPGHMHSGYKMGGQQQHPGAGPGQQMGPYPPQGQQYPPQGNYNPRPQGQLGSMQYGPNQGYGPGPGPGPGPAGQQNPQANNMGPGGQQYPSRPMPNHVPHSQFGGYQGGWHGPGGPPNMMGGKGGQPPQQQQQQPPNSPGQQGPRPHTPPNYLKQHLQHKMGFGAAAGGMPPSPGPYGGPGNGPTPGPPNMPPGSPGMGPPGNMHHMGSPMGPPPSGHHHPGMGPPPGGMGPPGPGSGMGPPSSAGPTAPPPTSAGGAAAQPPPMANSHGGGHHEGPMPPPAPGAPHSAHAEVPSDSPHENDSSSGAPGPLANASAGVTSVVTTGPDGAPLDEGSQQSTLSNASAASGEDPACTPKARGGGKGDPAGMYHGHPATPLSTAPSPGAASVNSMHEEYGEVNSPSWPRTPASPVFNSHVHQDPYRSKKPDSLCKLYEMDESHERRLWLDKLLQYMEERGTPISACPTISKNPLDLFRLYLYVKERGGFMEVTKNKTWKDIAGLLGIGASSSAAYTLRKHYTKNLLAFECMFDRGGIDPQPIINQVEASSKKKGPKAASVPSPGSSNSQDSFPAAGSSGASLDGYGYGGYPPGSTPDYNAQPMQRPPSQTNSPSPHPGMQQGYPQGHPQGHPQAQGGGYSQYPDQYNRGPPQEYNQQYPPGQGGNYPPNRPMYPPYGAEGDRPYNQGVGPGAPPAPTMQPGADPYNRYPGMGPGQQPPGYPARTGYGGPPGPPAGPPAGPPNAQQPGYPGQQDYYRPDQQQPPQGYPGQQPPAGVTGPVYAGGPPSKSMPPPAPQPRRHPDFANKDPAQPPFPPYSQQPPPQQQQQQQQQQPPRPNMYGGWNNNQYRGQGYPPQASGPPGPQQWNQGPPRPAGPPNSQPINNQWDQHRYAPGQQPPYQNAQSGPQPWPPNMSSPGPNSSLRPQLGPRQPFRPEGKQFGPMQPPSMKSMTKREINFPLDSVESTLPVLYKRKRLTRADVAPVEAWRLMMSLRSGLLAESCWALDVLNVLLFDDSSVQYFGLGHLPGLLDVLLEHFRKSLANMFDTLPVVHEDGKWYGAVKSEHAAVDLGSVLLPIDCDDRVPLLGSSAANYTLVTRKGEAIRVVNKDCDIFVVDSHKEWDVEGEATQRSVTAGVDQDPWQMASAAGDNNISTKYIVACFQGEFGSVPFVRLLAGKPVPVPPAQEAAVEAVGTEEADAEKTREETTAATLAVPEDTSLRLCDDAAAAVTAATIATVKVETGLDKTDEVCSEKAFVIVSKKTEDVVVVVSKESSAVVAERKNCEKRKRTKTLSDVLSRIKKEPAAEVNDVLAREIREKVEKNEIVLKAEGREDEINAYDKDSFAGGKNICNDKTNVLDDKTNIAGGKIVCNDKQTDKAVVVADIKTIGVADKTDITRDTISDVKAVVSPINTPVAEENNTSDNTLVVPKIEPDASHDKAPVCNSMANPDEKTPDEKTPDEPMETDEAKTSTEPSAVPSVESESESLESKSEVKQESEEDEDSKTPKIRDPAGTLKRRRISDYEDECYARDEASLYLVTETQDSLARRCVCLSNILRNLTFVPGNETEFAKSGVFLGLLGKLLLLHHEHPVRTHKQRNYDREEDADFADSCSSLQGEGEWWWEFLHQIRENVLVTAANIAGHMDLSQHPEEISRPVLDGLLHWAVCPAAHGQDPFPNVGPTSPLSPQRLALEALCKLCVTDANVDLVIATPPYSRLERLCAVLTKFLSRSEEQVLREFAVNLLHYLAAADSGVARTVALQSPCVSLLVAFVEQAEASALGVANQHGIGALRDNPDSMGTSLDMLRRAAGTLLHLARHPDNRPLFLQQEQRLLALVMSQILDQQVASIISRVLFQCSRPHPDGSHRVPSS